MPTTAYAVTVTPPVAGGYYLPVEVRFEHAAAPAAEPNPNPAYTTRDGSTPLQGRQLISDATTFYFPAVTPVLLTTWAGGDDASKQSVTPAAYATPTAVVLAPSSSGTPSTEASSRFASIVSHGSTAGTARTTGAPQVIWLGTVEPTNGVDGDLWVSATGLSFRASGVWSTTTSNAFVPSSVTGLIAWFRADLITGLANADPISTWTDLSGNGNNLTSTSTARPTYRTNVINGKAVARFDGINDYMTRTYGSALTQPTTIFVVYKAATLEQTVIIDGLGSSRHSILTESGTNYLRMYAGTTIVGTTAFTTSAAVVSATFSGAASDMRLNGTTIITGNPGTQTMSGINLGADPGFAYYFDGDIAEVLIYNSALSLADRQYVERALGTFYGVTVA